MHCTERDRPRGEDSGLRRLQRQPNRPRTPGPAALRVTHLLVTDRIACRRRARAGTAQFCTPAVAWRWASGGAHIWPFCSLGGPPGRGGAGRLRDREGHRDRLGHRVQNSVAGQQVRAGSGGSRRNVSHVLVRRGRCLRQGKYLVAATGWLACPGGRGSPGGCVPAHGNGGPAPAASGQVPAPRRTSGVPTMAWTRRAAAAARRDPGQGGSVTSSLAEGAATRKNTAQVNSIHFQATMYTLQ